MTAPLRPRRPLEGAPLRGGASWTDVAGASAGIAQAAIKAAGRDDVVVLHAPGAAAAVVTRSTALAAPCRWTRQRVPGPCRAVVINSGNANASTGAQGHEDARAMAEAAAEVLDCPADQVLVCSTGVIGVPMPMGRVLPGVRAAAGALGVDGHRAARAILTTDLVPKEAGCEVDGVAVAGMAKGSGMIHPDMGTMLGFVVTDAEVEPAALQALVERVADVTFNAVTVDGDTSTNDTLIVQATGRGRAVRAGESGFEALEAGLTAVCRSLARAIAADGEGAGRLISVLVEGTPEDGVARAAARAIARSPLVKTAIAGRDANWGRIVGALGAVRVSDLDRLDLDLAGIPVLRSGAPIPVDEAAAREALGAAEIVIHARLPGPGVGEAWGCDLTEGYIRINADYRS